MSLSSCSPQQDKNGLKEEKESDIGGYYMSCVDYPTVNKKGGNVKKQRTALPRKKRARNVPEEAQTLNGLDRDLQSTFPDTPRTEGNRETD